MSFSLLEHSSLFHMFYSANNSTSGGFKQQEKSVMEKTDDKPELCDLSMIWFSVCVNKVAIQLCLGRTIQYFYPRDYHK